MTRVAKQRRTRFTEEGIVPTRRLTIEGMSCGHCVKAVAMALQDVPGVDVRDVRVGQAVIDADATAVSRDQLATAIDEAGFTLAGVADIEPR